MLRFDEKSIFKESVCNLTPTNSCWSWGIGFLVFHSVSRVDFVHCGQVPHGVRVPLCKQIKLSSGLGQGVKNAIRQRFRQRTAYHLQQNPLPVFSHSMENRLLFAFTSSIFCLLQSSTSSVITLLPVLLSVLLFLFEILPPLGPSKNEVFAGTIQLQR